MRNGTQQPGGGMPKKRIVWNMPRISADGLRLFACGVLLLQSIGVSVIERKLIGLDQYTTESLNAAMSSDSNLMMLAGIGSVLQLLGGLALPVIAFLLVERFKEGEGLKQYCIAAAVLALLSELPYDLAFEGKLLEFSSQNMIFSICICLIMLYGLRLVSPVQGWQKAFFELVIVIASVFWVSLIRGEYGLCLVLLCAVFYVFYSKNVLKTVLGMIISLLYVTGPLAFYGIWCYSGERKKPLPTYIYYIFYPLHLLILGLIVKFL